MPRQDDAERRTPNAERRTPNVERQPPRIHRLLLPFLGRFAVVRDNGEARFASGLICGTHLRARIFRGGRLVDEVDLGSGLVTVTAVNTLVTDAVTGSSVVPTLARFKYQSLGTSSTAATDGDTALGTEGGPATRATATLSNGQTATTGNHTAKLTYTATTTLGGSLAITEWALHDSATNGAGNMMDHRVFSVINLSSGDSFQGVFQLSLPSNN